MPPRVTVRSSSLRATCFEPYICLSCLRRPAAKPSSLKTTSRSSSRQQQSARAFASPSIRSPRQKLQLPNHERRFTAVASKRTASNGSLASSSAINGQAAVPPQLRELDLQLSLLQDKASSYVALSRLQLALRSLESSHPVVRAAFLGLDAAGVRAARHLACALLSDALGAREPWEDTLLNISDEQALLLKHGDWIESSGVVGGGAGSELVQTIYIPSPLLRDHNLEILITSLNTDSSVSRPSEADKAVEETVVVPLLTMPNSTGGQRVGFVRYPVHKALVVADGVGGAIKYGRLGTTLVEGPLVKPALNLALTGSKQEGVDSAVDVDLAARALERFRENRANGADYISDWQTSRISSISDWLTNSTENTDGLNPAVANLVKSILAHTSQAIAAAESASRSSSDALTAPEGTRTALRSALDTWSEESHRDLQVNLTAALASSVWHRTAWWRLFWRIDEVGLSASHVVQHGWLVEAEQSLAFLSGRLIQAGLASPEGLKGEQQQQRPQEQEQGQQNSPSPPDSPPGRLLTPTMRQEISEFQATQRPAAAPRRIETPAELLQLPPLLARVRARTGLDALFDPPWPATVGLARAQLLHQRIPTLHRAAQNALLATASTMAGTAALAGWWSIATGGVYEAGAIAALGLVAALARLQRKWGRDRTAFVRDLRETGRQVLDDIDARLRRVIAHGGRVEMRQEDERERSDARAAVEACRRALAKARKNDG